MGRYTKQDVIDLVRENDVEFIRLQFSDLFGTMKNVAITARQLEKALDNKCTFDGSSVDGFVRIEESDMYLYPDLDSFAIFPWNAGGNRVARLICDVYGQDGLPFAGDPRNVLKRVMVECQKMGYKFNVGPECEFFLFHTDEEGRPTTVSHEKAGYFDVAPLDLGESARRDMILNLEDMGFEIEASHHEVAPAQHEIDFKYDNALRTADNILTFKFIVNILLKDMDFMQVLCQNRSLEWTVQECILTCLYGRMERIFSLILRMILESVRRLFTSWLELWNMQMRCA